MWKWQMRRCESDRLSASRQAQRASPYEFVQARPLAASSRPLPGNPYDGHTLAEVYPDMEALMATGSKGSSPIAGYRARAYRAKFDEALKRSHG
jgi:hypothetical protein